MALSNDLISQFVKITNDDVKSKSESTVYGKIVVYNDKNYVKIDGSDLLTPISSTTSIDDGDRVTVMIKNHSAVVTGNISSPSVGSGVVDEKIREFNLVITDELIAAKARIDDLEADNIVVKDRLTANEAYISDLQADNVTINDTLTATQANIEKLKTEKLDADAADIKYATIENLDATNATIHNLEATYGEFHDLTTDKFTAIDATIENLDVKYADIEFANIGKAAMENFYAKSGLIENVVVGDETITGELVGVTIKGDLIEGNTIVADKLVIKGSDGLYYKLNTDGMTIEAEQTEYNSLNGSVIIAKSITATKIAVSDLVAFDATIAGFYITDDTIYSGVKETVDNGTRGIYLDKTGQVAFGDSKHYLKYYKDSNGEYVLDISAKSFTFGVENKNIEDAISDIESKTVYDVDIMYAISDSHTVPPAIGWDTVAPTWEKDKYIWQKTVVTYGDGTTDESEPTCITGATGSEGIPGADGRGITSITEEYYQSTSSSSLLGGSWSTTYPGWEDGTYIWTRSVITYTDTTTDTTTPICVTGSKGETGSQGPQGVPGPKGDDGIQYYTWLKYADTPTEGMSDDPTGKDYIGLAYNKTTPTESEDYSDYTWSLIKGEQGNQGVPGNDGADGETYYTWIKYATSSSGDDMSDDPTDKDYIGLAYNKLTAEESEDPNEYTWSLIKGEQGKQGESGIDFAQGKMLYTDPMFMNGVNSTSKYALSGEEYLTWERVEKSEDNPMSGTDYEMVCTNTGEVEPANGGFYWSHDARANAVFVYRIIAKIPVGRNLCWATNETGDGGNSKWLTSNEGTDKFTEYLYRLECGGSGTFSTTGFFYVDGTVGTEEEPLKWYVAYATVFDMTNVSDIQEASKVATNYLNFDGTGLVIGDMTASTLGRNVLIDSDSVDIRNGDTILASYGDDYIYLGKNSRSSIINLCNGIASLHIDTSNNPDLTYDKLVIEATHGLQMEAKHDVYLEAMHSSSKYAYAELFSSIPWDDYSTSVNPTVRLEVVDESSNGSLLLNSLQSKISCYSTYSTYLTLDSSNGYVDLYGELRIRMLSPTYHYDNIIINNDCSYRIKDKSDIERMVLSYGANNILCLGWDNYQYKLGDTYILGNEVLTCTSHANFVPYYKPGDTININWFGSGFLTNSKTWVCFTIPLSKPIIGNPTISAYTVDGFILRQNNSYTHGSTASVKIAANSFNQVTLIGTDFIRIRAEFQDTTNAINNAPIGIDCDIQLVLS